MRQKDEDNIQINRLLEVLFKETYGDEGMYFDEFQKLASDVTSELFVCVYNCIYQYVPCVKNFLMLRENYITYLKGPKSKQLGIEFKPYTHTILMPPVLKKMLDKISEVDELPKNNKIINQLRGGLKAFKKENSPSPETQDSSVQNKIMKALYN